MLKSGWFSSSRVTDARIPLRGGCCPRLVDAAELYDDPDPVNLGAGFEISMLELARRVSAHVGYRGAIQWDAARPNGQPRRMLDASRAKERLGFVATTDFDEGLARTIAWFREHASEIRTRERLHAQAGDRSIATAAS